MQPLLFSGSLNSLSPAVDGRLKVNHDIHKGIQRVMKCNEWDFTIFHPRWVGLVGSFVFLLQSFLAFVSASARCELGALVGCGGVCEHFWLAAQRTAGQGQRCFFSSLRAN